MKTVVILGGSLGGLAITHRLLKYTLPHDKDLKVILVSKNTHFYWNVASIRAVIPGVLQDDQILQPIEPGLAQYPSGSVEFILGAATGIDTASKAVHVSLPGDAASRDVNYDYLVLATGTTSKNPQMPWKASSTHEECLTALHTTAARIKSASHIVVAGAGATGVELCGEIRYEFPHKTVVLLAAEEHLVGGDAIAGAVERELSRLGVEIRKSARVASSEENEERKTIVRLENGEEVVTDLYLPTMGFVPNTNFVPDSFLNESGYADVDEYMAVKGQDGIWAAGDIVSKPRAGFLITEAQAAGVAKNIDHVLRGKQQQVVHGPPLDIFICSMGRSRAAGRFGPVPIPSLAAWIGKGRTLGIDRTKKYVDGSMW